MKKTFKIASVILAIAMIFSVCGVSAFAYDASSGQSSLTNVTLSNGTITGNFNIYGWLNNIEARIGSESGTVVGTYTNPAGDWTTSGPFSITLSDGGNATASYYVIMTNTNGTEKVVCEIPYSGPVYQMEIQRNGARISSVDLGLNEGVASGFTFVYESGRACTYEVSDSSVISVARSGDNFTITPLKVGSATIKAKCDDTNEQTLTVNVIDDSSLAAVWYATQASITNGATFEANCGKSYGFGVEAFPDDVKVELTANTAGATLTESTIEGQFPYAIKGATAGGSATVKISGQTKTITFTVNFTEAAFDFFMDASFDEVAEPLVAVPVNTSVTVYANKTVASWAVDGTGCSYTTTGTSITLTGVTVDTITTITAKDANGNTIQWFDAYVTGEAAVEPPTPSSCVFTAFKVNQVRAYNSYFGAFDADAETIIVNKRAFVPLRYSSMLLGASVEYDAATREVMLSFESFKAKLTIDSTDISFYKLDGTPVFSSTIEAEDQVPIIVNKSTYLPARVLGQIANMAGSTRIEYVDDATSGGIGQYVVYILGSEVPTQAELKTMVETAYANF